MPSCSENVKYWACDSEPWYSNPKTLSPILKDFTFLPISSIFPANSDPGVCIFGLNKPVASLAINGIAPIVAQSVLFTVVAYTFTSTSSSLGVGLSTSLS